MVCSDLWSHDGRAVTGDVLLAAFVEVALGVLVHTGLAGAAGAGAVLRRGPPSDFLLRTAAGDARRRALGLVGRGLRVADGGVFLDSLDAVGCSHDSDREEVTRYRCWVTGNILCSTVTLSKHRIRLTSEPCRSNRGGFKGPTPFKVDFANVF